MESFNGNTIRIQKKVVWGLERGDSAILMSLCLYHNLVRSHLGLSEGQTPSEAVDIHIQGEDQRRTIIQAATKVVRVVLVRGIIPVIFDYFNHIF